MTEKLPAPCENCHATGLSNGSECLECQGKGYRLMINGQLIAIRTPAAPRGPWRNHRGPIRTGDRKVG